MPPRVRPGIVLRSDLRSALRGDGPAAWAAAALLLAVLAMLVARRSSQGAVETAPALGDITTVLDQVLPLVVLLGAGTRLVQRHEGGLDVDQHLAGIKAGQRLLVVAADALVLLLATLTALPVWMVGATGDVRCLLDRSLMSVAGGLTLSVLTLALLTAAVARALPNVAVFALTVVLLAAVGSAAYWAGPVNPAFDDLSRVWPTQAGMTFFTASSARGWSMGVGAAVLSAIGAVVVLLRTADLSRPPRHLRPALGKRARNGSVRAYHRTRRVLGLSLAAMAWGVAVPATLGAQVPWYLRPAWLSQESHHRSSVDVTRAWLTAVQADDAGSAARWGGPTEQLIGPLSPLVKLLDPSTAQVERTRESHPGQVVVERSARDQSLGTIRLYVCLRPRESTWQVTAVRSAGDCPAAYPGQP